MVGRFILRSMECVAKPLVPMLLGPVGPSVGTSCWSFATPSMGRGN